MAEHTTVEAIADLEAAVNAGLEYFTGEGEAANARAGDWGVWEVLCHMLFWHRATLEGVESVSAGGGPKRLQTDTDEINARYIEGRSGSSAKELAEDLRTLQADLVAAVRRMPDPAATVFVRRSGASSSAIDRLQMITSHWNGHVEELRRQS